MRGYISDSNSAASFMGGSNLVEDFIYESLSNWTTTTNGDGAAVSVNGSQQAAGHPGILDLETGTDAAGGAGVRRGAGGAILLTSGEVVCDFVVKMDELATVAEDFVVNIGLGVTFSASSSVGDVPGDNAVVFQYNRGTSVNWLGITKASGTPTTASGGTNVAVDTNWTHLRFVVNAAGTSVRFYVDNVLIGTSASNIPTAGMGIGMLIKKTAGTTERDLFIDLARFAQDTARF